MRSFWRSRGEPAAARQRRSRAAGAGRGCAVPAQALGQTAVVAEVGHFVHYFRDFRGYSECFGIDPERCSFVPFKPNLRYRLDEAPEAEGDYVLCLGRSLRDYDTFFAAAEIFAVPAAIPAPDWRQLAIHGSRFTRKLDRLPRNVSVLDDDGSQDAMIRLIKGARLVALPILKSTIVASGISTYLNAMLMGKCVILSEGPGGSDILTNEALFVPPRIPRPWRGWSDGRGRTRNFGVEPHQRVTGTRSPLAENRSFASAFSRSRYDGCSLGPESATAEYLCSHISARFTGGSDRRYFPPPGGIPWATRVRIETS